MPDVGRSIAAVLLAAGGSTRMGTAKQLLPYRGCTLLRHAAEVVVVADCRPTAVVLGADGVRLEQELTGLPVSVIHNLDCAKGIGTSIRMGVQVIHAIADDAAAVIITVCDQPLLHLEVIQQLCAAFWAQRKGIVASDYGGILGVPALFERCYFSRLLNLADGEGAKRLILDAGEDVCGVSFSGGAFDLDTPQDYAKVQAVDGDHRPPYSNEPSTEATLQDNK